MGTSKRGFYPEKSGQLKCTTWKVIALKEANGEDPKKRV
jgi:hypothetical protein